jgi:hypothetical protein
MITVKLDADKVIKMGDRLIKWANVEIKNLTEAEAKIGAIYAATIAPRDSGALIQAIDYAPGKKATEWKVVSRTPKNPFSKRRVPYQMYMHLGLTGRRKHNNYKGGKDPRYMITTAKWLAGDYPIKIIKSLRKVNK